MKKYCYRNCNESAKKNKVATKKELPKNNSSKENGSEEVSLLPGC